MDGTSGSGWTGNMVRVSSLPPKYFPGTLDLTKYVWSRSPTTLKAGLKGNHMDDPAIASIDSIGSGESSRRGTGGFGEGFGFGGGIGGGRGMGRGGKNMG